MIGAGIFDGDLAVVQPQKERRVPAISSSPVPAMAKGPSNPQGVTAIFCSRKIPGCFAIHDEFDVVGKVVGVLRRHG